MKVPQKLLDMRDDSRNRLHAAKAEFAALEAAIVAIEAAEFAARETDTPQQRMPRRNIRALVKEQLALGAQGLPGFSDAALIADKLGCRRSQVEAALKWINGGQE